MNVDTIEKAISIGEQIHRHNSGIISTNVQLDIPADAWRCDIHTETCHHIVPIEADTREEAGVLSGVICGFLGSNTTSWQGKNHEKGKLYKATPNPQSDVGMDHEYIGFLQLTEPEGIG